MGKRNVRRGRDRKSQMSASKYVWMVFLEDDARDCG